MKNIIDRIIFGKANKLNGLIASVIIGLIVLGCTCNKDFKSNSGQDRSSNTSPTDKTTTPFGNDKDQNSLEKDNITKDSGFDILSNGQLQPLIRKTILDFADSVDDEDFNSFLSTCSTAFQREISTEKMETEFKVFLDKKNQFVPIFRQVSSKEAIISESKVTMKDGNNTLIANGTFKTSPSTTTFKFKFLLEDGIWRITAIEIYVK